MRMFCSLISFCTNFSMARITVTPKKGGTKILKTQTVVHAVRWSQGPSSPVHPLISSTRNPSRTRGNHKTYSRGRAARGDGEVATVIANLMAGPDGCRGQAIYTGWRGAGQKEALTNCGRQAPRKELLKDGKVKKTHKY